MKGDLIPRTDHVALHCQPKTGLEYNGVGIPVGITKDAFRADDDGISSNWVEYDGGNFATVCLCLASVRHARKSHGVATINVGELIDVALDGGKEASAIHDPIELQRPNPGHSLIVGLGAADHEILDVLALTADVAPFTEDSIAQSKAIFGR
ncbi:MAG: hypothetical protein WAV27_08465 [Xanthobacteraceae bacterium]